MCRIWPAGIKESELTIFLGDIGGENAMGAFDGPEEVSGKQGKVKSCAITQR